MPTYMYKAMTKTGVVVRNRVEFASKQNLIKTLKSNDLLPISIEQISYSSKKTPKRKKKNITDIQEIMKNVNTTQLNKEKKMTLSTKEKINMYLAKTEKITQRDIVVFTQNFYLLKKANFNNIHALNTIIESTENISFRGILEDILAGVEAGENMYTTMEYYSNVFPYIYINMIKVGELSGSLTNSLEQAVKYLDDTESLNKKLRTILIPNIIQFVLLLVMLVVGTLVAIPAIQGIFDELGTDETLPAVTLWFADFIKKAIKYWYLPVLIIVAAVAGVLFYINTPKGKYNFHYFKYKMPIFGQLIFALDFSRLMKAMLLNLKNGMRIQESLEVSKNVVKNYVMLSMIETSINNILTGTSWIEPFEKSGLAKPMITEMLKIGMQTDLTEMMEKLVEYMEIDIDNIMRKIMQVLPQVVYAIVGVVLIFFVLVVLVPCIQVYMGNFLFSAYGV
ncbi:MAG TPA: type II secretion system F family protein [Clostridiaceae bacterium]|jgi:type IV pilus assembly protein PilC|nr:type II secretion system F family protein [Clostridiaceae bacterium]